MFKISTKQVFLYSVVNKFIFIDRITEANRKKKNQEHLSSHKAEENKANNTPSVSRLPTPHINSQMQRYSGQYQPRYPGAPVPNNSHAYGSQPQHYGGPHANLGNSMSPKPQMYPQGQHHPHHPYPIPAAGSTNVPGSYQHQQPTPHSIPQQQQQQQQQQPISSSDKTSESAKPVSVPPPAAAAAAVTVAATTASTSKQLPAIENSTSSNPPSSVAPKTSAASTESKTTNDTSTDQQTGKDTVAPHSSAPTVKSSVPQYKMSVPPQPGHTGTPASGQMMPYQPRPAHDPYSRSYPSSQHQGMPPPSPFYRYNLNFVTTLKLSL